MNLIKTIFLLFTLLASQIAFCCNNLQGYFEYNSLKTLQVREDHHIRMKMSGSKQRVQELKKLKYQCRRVTTNDTQCHKFLKDHKLPKSIRDRIVGEYQATSIYFFAPTHNNELITNTPYYRSVKVHAKTNYSGSIFDFYLLNSSKSSNSELNKLVFYYHGNPSPKQELVYNCENISKVISKRKYLNRNVSRNYLIGVIYK